MLNFEKLQTPPGDGDILLEPSPRHWPQLIDANRRRLTQQTIAVAGVPVEALRQSTRRMILRSVPETPVIAAGHQPGFVHPGVWAKHVVVRHLATNHAATAINLVVDHDAPATDTLSVPVVGPDHFVTTSDIPFNDAPAGSAYEGRHLLDQATLNQKRRALLDALGPYYEESLIGPYLDGLASASAATAATPPRDAVDQHLAARAAIDAPLAADLHELRVSETFGGAFLAELLLHADRFAAAYNKALADYRHRQRVRSPNRPLPDLATDGQRIETALWIYCPLQRRRRLWVEPHADKLVCYADQSRIGEVAVKDLMRDADGALTPLRPWVVRPRALTLTLWARLLVCDLFVHGIGGATYDRITDHIFRRFFKSEPPAYVCVTATLRIPLPRHAVSHADWVNAQHRIRDFRYNPDRYLSEPPSHWLVERQERIRESDRLRATQASHATRREVFLAIRRLNDQLTQSQPTLAGELVNRLERIQRQRDSNRVADSREFFYALHAPDRLAKLADRLREITAG